MKKTIRKVCIVSALALVTNIAHAGNPQRSGSAGAPELLINPWASSSGWGGVNIAGVSGIEATFLNIAGTAATKRTEVGFTNTQWLVGAGININAAAFTQKVGTSGVLGASFMGLDYGDWERTTGDNPDGGIGTISPNAVTIGLSYAQKFTQSIQGGINIKLFSQSSTNLSVSALCFDAGVQYVTGKQKQLKFGITLKNVGPSVSYKGDGKSINLPVPQTGYSQSYEERSATFELPTTLMLGGSYDFIFESQVLTLAGAFQSNSFEKDQYTLGAQYMFKKIVGVRAGYTLYDNRDYEVNTTAFSGPSAGIMLAVPMGDSGTTFSLDYSYRATSVFNGVHAIGLLFTL